jgi:polyphosphate kinase
LSLKKRYKHRDINWLSFNERVLLEADCEDTPLLERLKFLAIFSSNLDEFFKVRISQLRQLKKVDKNLRKRLMTRSSKTLKKILAIVNEQQELFGSILERIYVGLKAHGIYFETDTSGNSNQKKYVEKLFLDDIQKDCQVLEAIDSRSLEDGRLYLLVLHSDDHFSIVNLPVDVHGRFLQLPGEDIHYIFLDDAVRLNLHCLFPKAAIRASFAIKLSRDAELYLDDETSDTELVERIYASLKKRSSGQPTRLLYDSAMPAGVRTALRDRLGIAEIDMFPGGRYHNYSDFLSFSPDKEDAGLRYTPMPPLPHPVLSGNPDLFEAIGKKDRLIHFPYHEFRVVEDLVYQAASDSDVNSIKISLYRIAKKSRLTDALLRALEQNKKVTIFVEAKARFDERNNIRWGKSFRDKGVTVIFSVPNIKVHAKIMMIERNEGGQATYYGYIGTGNFNAKTATVYCDHGLFTSDKRITTDLQQVFLTLEKKIIIPKLKYLLVSPYNSRTTFMERIEEEIAHSMAGRNSGIYAKLNSHEDRTMIDAHDRASDAGVKVNLLVRGFCCLINKNIDGSNQLNKNLQVHSIIDRFLEHGRIYYFENNGHPKVYIGSADWMVRNLDKRIEVLVPILDTDVHDELVKVMRIQFADNVKARLIDNDDSNQKVPVGPGEKSIRSQYALYDFLKAKIRNQNSSV